MLYASEMGIEHVLLPVYSFMPMAVPGSVKSLPSPERLLFGPNSASNYICYASVQRSQLPVSGSGVKACCDGKGPGRPARVPQHSAACYQPGHPTQLHP